jgi:hypothetical protein
MNLFRALCESTRNSWNFLEMTGGGLNGPDGAARTDWRKARLAAAATRYGRPFKCAGEDMLREVLIGGRELVTVSGGKKPASIKGTARPTLAQRRPRLTILHGS